MPPVRKRTGGHSSRFLCTSHSCEGPPSHFFQPPTCLKRSQPGCPLPRTPSSRQRPQGAGPAAVARLAGGVRQGWAEWIPLPLPLSGTMSVPCRAKESSSHQLRRARSQDTLGHDVDNVWRGPANAPSGQVGDNPPFEAASPSAALPCRLDYSRDRTGLTNLHRAISGVSA
jgi:hypothetical protein